MSVERFTFVASGHDSVVQAFRSIDQAAARTESKVARSFASMPRAAQRSGTSAERAQQRRINALARQRERDQRRRERAAERELRQLERKLEKEARIEQRAQAKREREAARAHQRAVRRDQRVRQQRRAELRNAGRMVLGVGAAMAGAAAGVLVRAGGEGVRLRDRTARLAIKGGQRDQGAALARQFENQAIATPGATAADLASAAEAFVAKTGDLDAARAFTKAIAEVSIATDTAAADLGSTAADLFQKFDVKTAEDMSRALATLAVQGKRGAFELSDAAAQFPRLASAAARVGLTGASGLATLGGLSQLARTATGSGEAAATSVEAMLSQLIGQSSLIERRTGAKVFTDSTKSQVRDVREVLVDTIAGSGGNLQVLGQIFGRQGIRAASPLISTFTKARDEATGSEAERTAAGVRALREAIARATDAADAEAEIKRDLAAAQQTSSAQLTAAWEALKGQLGESLTPVLVDLAGRFAQLVREVDFTPLVDGIMAAAEGLVGLVGFLQDTGLIAKRSKPAAGADERIAALELEKEQVRQSGMSPAEALAKIDKIDAQIDTARGQKRVASLVAGAGEHEQFVSGADFMRVFGEREGAGANMAKLLRDPTKLIATGMTTSAAERETVRDFRESVQFARAAPGAAINQAASQATGTTDEQVAQINEALATVNASLEGIDDPGARIAKQAEAISAALQAVTAALQSGAGAVGGAAGPTAFHN